MQNLYVRQTKSINSDIHILRTCGMIFRS